MKAPQFLVFFLGIISLAPSIPAGLTEEACPQCSGRATPVLEDSPQSSILKAQSDINKHLNSFAASDYEVNSANCIRKAPFSSKEMSDWLTSYYAKNTERTSETISGIQFKDENPLALELFRKLTVPGKNFSGDYEVPPKTFKSKCTRVDCAISEIFGATAGKKLEFMLARFGMNGSHHVFHNSDSWRSADLDPILLALSDLPQRMLPLQDNKQLTHFKRGYSLALYGKGSGVVANASISVFDPWDSETPQMKRYTIFHEVAHNVASELDADDDPEWMNQGGWTKKPGKTIFDDTYSSFKTQGFVSEYAKTNPAEDFAETFSAYRYNPRGLRQTSPQKFEFMRNSIFAEVSYLSKAACSPEKGWLDTFEAVTQKATTAPHKWEENTTRTLVSACGNELVRGEFQQLDACIRAGVLKTLQDAACKELKCTPWQLKQLKYYSWISAVSAATLETAKTAAIEKTRGLYVEALMAIDKSKSYEFPSTTKEAPFCEAWAAYGYQKADPVFKPSLGDDQKFLVFSNRETVENLLQRMCVAGQSKKMFRRALDRAEAEAAVDEVLGS